MAWRLRPSSADSWGRCYGSLAMRERYPQWDDSDTKEGLAWHDLAKSSLTGQPLTPIGSIVRDDVVITEEMHKTVAEYHRFAASWGIPLYVERPMPIPDIHPTECGGTPDVWAWNAATYTIHLLDGKFGRIPVDVFENKQLICYVSGIATLLGVDGSHDQHIWVEMTIYQPRLYKADGPFYTWRVKLSDLRAHINKLRMAGEYALEQNAPLNVDPIACTHCSARGKCNALQKSSYYGIAVSTAPAPIELSTWAASNELAMLDEAIAILDARRSGLTVEIEHGLLAGNVAPKHTLERKGTRERWKDGAAQALTGVAALMGKSIIKDIELITPRQAREILPPELVSKYAEKPTGELVVAPLNTKTTRKIFGANKS